MEDPRNVGGAMTAGRPRVGPAVSSAVMRPAAAEEVEAAGSDWEDIPILISDPLGFQNV